LGCEVHYIYQRKTWQGNRGRKLGVCDGVAIVASSHIGDATSRILAFNIGEQLLERQFCGMWAGIPVPQRSCGDKSRLRHQCRLDLMQRDPTSHYKRFK
jgi:hypothetical protein